ncbi:ATP-dependent DNA helicase MPH1 [Smittium mucronatum]|uniref:ATP-dependent DNA helicase MPH1 n=1 Tax=Smittium mucronatum TaxID=133383 RepID=A0A1R0GZ64_9FUNG|nr:ATP-dependent DNA helicase MPH1 [Smittium mucronatum]
METIDVDSEFEFDEDILKIVQEAEAEYSNFQTKNVDESIDISSGLSDSLIDSIDWDEIELDSYPDYNQRNTNKEKKNAEPNQKLHMENNVNQGNDSMLNDFQVSSESFKPKADSVDFIPVIPSSGALEEDHLYDSKSLNCYLYPIIEGQQIRSYQQSSILSCIRGNTLVALPTGLGKTYIAAVVMGNYSRWFPNSLIIFLATTRPLVTQQAKACAPLLYILNSQNNIPSEKLDTPRVTSEMDLKDHKISGETHNFTLNGKNYKDKLICEMNGSLHPSKRKLAWSTSTFVFATPQTVQNDLRNGVLGGDNVKRITMLIVDEAHKTRGGYAFGNCMDELIKIQESDSSPNGASNSSGLPLTKSKFRVLALTATPGADIKSVQMVVDRLHLANGFFRTEQSIDVVTYLHGRNMNEVIVTLPQWHKEIVDLLSQIVKKPLDKLCTEFKVITRVNNPKSVSPYFVNSSTLRWVSYQGGRSRNNQIESVVWNLSKLSSKLLQALQLMQTQSFLSGYRYLNELITEVASYKNDPSAIVNKLKLECVESPEFRKLEKSCNIIVKRINAANPQSENPMPIQICGISIPPGKIFSHPKLSRMLEIVLHHLNENGDSTRIMIFTQFRESVDEIVSIFKAHEPLAKPAAFVGQSKASHGASTNTEDFGYDIPFDTPDDSGSFGNTFYKNRASKNPRGSYRGRSRGGYNRGNRGRGYNSFGKKGNLLENDPEPIEDSAPKEPVSVGVKGQTQKEQQKVVTDFTRGIFNILVATSVAEEGLDIGEVDLVVHYDAPKSPIQLLQRTGRTGRTRKGGAIVMLTDKTNEYQKYKEAIRKYQSVQNQMSKPGIINWHHSLSAKLLPNYCQFSKSRRLTNSYPRRIELEIKPTDYKIGVKLGEIDLMTKAELKKIVSDEKAEMKRLDKELKKLSKESTPSRKRLKKLKSNANSNLSFDSLSKYNSNGSSIESEGSDGTFDSKKCSDVEIENSAKKLFNGGVKSSRTRRKFAIDSNSNSNSNSDSGSNSDSDFSSKFGSKKTNIELEKKKSRSKANVESSDHDSRENIDNVSKKMKIIARKSNLRSNAMEKLLKSREKNREIINETLKKLDSQKESPDPKKNDANKDNLEHFTPTVISKPENLLDFLQVSPKNISKMSSDLESEMNPLKIEKRVEDNIPKIKPDVQFIDLEDSEDYFNFDHKKLDILLIDMAKKLGINLFDGGDILSELNNKIKIPTEMKSKSMLYNELETPKYFTKLGSITKLVSSDTDPEPEPYYFHVEGVLDPMSNHFKTETFQSPKKKLLAKNEYSSSENLLHRLDYLDEPGGLFLSEDAKEKNSLNIGLSDTKLDELSFSDDQDFSHFSESVQSLVKEDEKNTNEKTSLNPPPKKDIETPDSKEVSGTEKFKKTSPFTFQKNHGNIFLSDDIDFSDIETAIFRVESERKETLNIIQKKPANLQMEKKIENNEPGLSDNFNSSIFVTDTNDANKFMDICSSISDTISKSFELLSDSDMVKTNNTKSNPTAIITSKNLEIPEKKSYGHLEYVSDSDYENFEPIKEANDRFPKNKTRDNFAGSKIDSSNNSKYPLDGFDVIDPYRTGINNKFINKPKGNEIIYKKKARKRKSRSKNVSKFFDDEAESDNDEIYSGGDSDDPKFMKNKGSLKKLHKASKSTEANHNGEEEQEEDLDRSLDDGFIVSDDHIVYNSSQSFAVSQLGTESHHEFLDPLEKGLEYKEGSDVISLDGKNFQTMVNLPNDYVFSTPQKKTKKKMKDRGDRFEPDDVSIYRRANNNDLTPVSEIKRQVKMWEEKFLSHEQKIKENRAEKMGSRVASAIFAGEAINGRNSNLINPNIKTKGVGGFGEEMDDDFEPKGFNARKIDNNQDYYSLLVKNNQTNQRYMESPLADKSFEYETYLSQSSTSLLDGNEYGGGTVEPDEFDNLLDKALKPNKQQSNDDMEIGLGITNNEDVNIAQKKKMLRRGRKGN